MLHAWLHAHGLTKQAQPCKYLNGSCAVIVGPLNAKWRWTIECLDLRGPEQHYPKQLAIKSINLIASLCLTVPEMGDQVELRWLKRNQELTGSTGVVIGPLNETGRWPLRLTAPSWLNGKMLNVKPENLWF